MQVVVRPKREAKPQTWRIVSDVGHDGRDASNDLTNLEVEPALEVLGQVELLGDGIVAISLNPGNDELGLLLVEERNGERLDGIRGLLWEVGDGESTDNRDHAGQNALHDKAGECSGQ